ncbi:MAG TPA: sulfatase-like hydrolase/transferase [Gammaproteobacteria bacterium]|nr:sulfatase-like hydrolase/transferase [Gammaproteobacteria bacterium]
MLRVFLVALVIGCIWSTAGHAQSDRETRPNVVLIMSDDLGWADLGSYGATDVRTPQLDRLAREGLRLTDFYANGVTCSPTRAGLISGRYQQRYGIEAPLANAARAGDSGLPATGHSLPQLLKSRGYATALIGKWHLGYVAEKSPNAHGFDYFFGLKSGYHDYYAHSDGEGRPDLWENDRAIQSDGYTTDLVTQRAARFIEEHKSGPFFLDVAYTAPHWPYQVPGSPSVAPNNARHVMPHNVGTSTRADYVAMVEHLDRQIGAVLAAIERAGIAENTIVIFTNDNGGEWLSSSAPFFGRKWTVFEGGIRVPAIVRWPNRIPAGIVSDQVGITMDLTASILAVTGATAPAETKLEGVDLFPVWEGRAPQIERTLFWRSGNGPAKQTAARRGDWKLLVDGPHTYVFNLRTDLSERNDLAKWRQDVAQELYPLLTNWEASVDADAMALRAAAPSGGR